MIRRNPPLSLLPLLLPSAVLMACGSGSGQVHVGTSRDAQIDAEASLEEEEPAPGEEDTEVAPAEGSDDAHADAADPGEDEGALGDDEDGEGHHEPPGAALARAALHSTSAPKNHLGLKMAVSERTSDLPWILAIENQSQHPVTLAALPELLSAEILPPPETESDESEGTATSPKKEVEPTVCGGGSLPKSLGQEDVVELAPGQLLFHAFDPRDLCEGEGPLEEGARVQLTYGFPLQTKKLWKGGKLQTVEVEQKAPFVAERKKTEEEFLPLKHLKAEPFVLDQTYPLSEVTPFPREEKEGDDAKEKDAPPPLELTIAPLGTTSSPEDGVVQVGLVNRSGKSMKIFIRRELLTYEVSGPLGEATCRMHPAERSPDPDAFSTLAPGESRSLTTRLAEACPAGTWDLPGTYSVSAFFQATADGEEHGLSAFMGSAATQQAARLVVPGKEESKRHRMRIVPVRPPED